LFNYPRRSENYCLLWYGFQLSDSTEKTRQS